MNLKSIFENIDAVIETVCKDVEDLSKMEKECTEDLERINSSYESEAKKN
jgi:prefoldin subunit 5